MTPTRSTEGEYGHDSSVFEGLPHFLHPDSKVTMDYEGAFHKGYSRYLEKRGFEFVVYRNPRSRRVFFSVPLPNLKQTWTSLVGEDILISGHGTVSTFLRPSSSNNAPLANQVSSNLHVCRPYLKLSTRPTQIGRSGLILITKRKGGSSDMKYLNAFPRSNI